MSTSKYTSAVLLLAVLAGTWLASIPLAELVFRLIGDTPSPDMKGLFAPFGEGNYKLGAFVDTHAFYAQGRKSIYTDQLGLRCDQTRQFATKPGDMIDVLLLGDSQGFGNGVNFEESIAGTFAQIEGEKGYKVANASVGGHGFASQYELARWLIDHQGLNVQNFVLLATPAMIYSGEKQDQVTVGDDGRLYGDGVGLGARLRLWTKTHLVIYSRLRDSIRNMGIGVDPTKKSASVFDFYKVGKQTDSVRSNFLNNVAKLKAFAEDHGANLYLVYVPLTVEADFAPVRTVAEKSRIALDPDVPLQIAYSAAEQLHISLYNLKPVLNNVRKQGHQLNVTGDFHYSPILSQACGSTLAAQLTLPTKETQLAKVNTKNATRR